MSITAEQIAMEYPIPTYRFRVSVGDEEIAFNIVSGLDITQETIEYKDGVGGRFQIPGQPDARNITLRKGIFRGQTGFYDWISSISLDTVEKKDISITLTNESGSEPFVTWTVADAFPTSLTAPSLDATSTEASIEELSLLAKSVSVIFH